MRSTLLAALCFGIIAPAVWGQGDARDFGTTAPPKVNVTLDPDSGEAAGDTPAAAHGGDEKIAEIQQAWDAAGAEAAAESNAGDTETDERDGGFSPGAAALRATGALCVVLLLVLLLAYLIKRFGKRTPMLAGQQLGQVLGRVALSPQASLHFIRTNGEVLVVGVTQQSVSLLRTFDAEDFEAAAAPLPVPERREETSGEQSFLDQLKDVQASMGTASPGVDQDLDSLKGDLQRLKQYFQDSARARE